jgi:hypothetical protein
MHLNHEYYLVMEFTQGLDKKFRDKILMVFNVNQEYGALNTGRL